MKIRKRSYAVYNKLTGEILKTGNCPTKLIGLQCNPANGERAMYAFDCRDADHKINLKTLKVVNKDGSEQ